MSEQEVNNILGDIRDFNYPNYKWELLTSDVDPITFSPLYHIVEYDFEKFIQIINNNETIDRLRNDGWALNQIIDHVKQSVSIFKESTTFRYTPHVSTEEKEKAIGYMLAGALSKIAAYANDKSNQYKIGYNEGIEAGRHDCYPDKI